MITINELAFKSIKEFIHYSGEMRNGEYGVKNLIDRVDNINKKFILSFNNEVGFFKRISSFIKEIFNIKISCNSILNNSSYINLNKFYDLNSLNNKEIINSDRVTIKYNYLNSKISFFLQEKMSDNKNNSNLINSFLKDNIKTKGDFLLFYSILNKLMSSMINEKNENRLRTNDSEGKFKFISKNDLSNKNTMFEKLNVIFYENNIDTEIKEYRIKNKVDLENLNKIKGVDAISNLIKFIHDLKEGEMRNEVFFLTLDNYKKKLDCFYNNDKLKIVSNNFKILLTPYCRELIMNDNKLNLYDFEINETFDSKDMYKNMYKDKLKLIFEEYKNTNSEKIEIIKNIIESCKKEIEFNNLFNDKQANYLSSNQDSLNELLSYF